jgi:hypothetical protein
VLIFVCFSQNKDQNNPLHLALLARDTSNTETILKAMIESKQAASDKTSLVNEPGDKKQVYLRCVSLSLSEIFAIW